MGERMGWGTATRVRCSQAVVWLTLACAPAVPVKAPPETPAPAPEPTTALPCLRVEQIEVSKSERRLRARCDGGSVVEMAVALGREPEGPKRDAGDLRTPEGSYRISAPSRRSRFHRFIPIDYPSVEDARVALAEGRISEAAYERIAAAHAQGAAPPGDTPLGGALGLHGEGERWRGDSADLDWTYGCVALTDDEIDFLADRIEVGTPVVILP
jgi:murein L,D-transpeptidase YafK